MNTTTESDSKGVLAVVGTPIGNLDDMSARGLALLRQADCIVCEDSRVTKKLTDRYVSEIDKALQAKEADLMAV